MKILVLGSGGREHALVWKIKQSPLVDKIYAIPGNAGMAQMAECIDLDLKDFARLADFVKKEAVELTVVGPEEPLVNGIADYFRQENLAIFGPEKQAAILEGSKIFAKNFMKKYGLPTADFKIFTNSHQAKDYIEQLAASSQSENFPLVIKADGLAAGKGVTVCHDPAEAIKAIHSIMEEEVFGKAGNQILVENFLKGEEASILAFCDGETIIPMMPSQDHKQVFDADKGLNTGGMGAYAPAPIVTKDLLNKIKTSILEPLKNGLKKEGIKYQGVIYVGIMIVHNEPFVLELNVRFGDPETQAILPLLESDLVPVLQAVVKEQLQTITLKWYNKYSVCVVLVSGGYPGRYEKGKVIYGLEVVNKVKDIMVFHAGTKLETSVTKNVVPIQHISQYVNWGGRVLGVTGLGTTLQDAIDRTYQAVETIAFEKMHYRKDIGAKGLKVHSS